MVGKGAGGGGRGYGGINGNGKIQKKIYMKINLALYQKYWNEEKIKAGNN